MTIVLHMQSSQDARTQQSSQKVTPTYQMIPNTGRITQAVVQMAATTMKRDRVPSKLTSHEVLQEQRTRQRVVWQTSRTVEVQREVETTVDEVAVTAQQTVPAMTIAGTG
ncbi:hypothetical protein L210DRAFT_3507105 [Boletus edulis BED1]|uniref:Uncharacterized protein n=1 Tax=Boletus edulis BED1 TaxID=1328754 RepID=A0AAD4BK92_BOLED|nr:hypothetical protein L210DRAFT_3507105 [Boletus edulis BED1]